MSEQRSPTPSPSVWTSIIALRVAQGTGRVGVAVDELLLDRTPPNSGRTEPGVVPLFSSCSPVSFMIDAATERPFREHHREISDDGHEPDQKRRRYRDQRDEGLAGDEENEHESVMPSCPGFVRQRHFAQGE